MLQPGADPVRKVSIIPRGRALGVTLSTPEADRYGYDANYLRGRIIGALGGHGGGAGGLQRRHHRRGERPGNRSPASPARWSAAGACPSGSARCRSCRPTAIRAWPGISDGLLDAVDEEVRRITDECYAEARRLLRENRDKLDAIVAQLLAHESLDEPEIYAAAGIPRTAVPPTPAPVPA